MINRYGGPSCTSCCCEKAQRASSSIIAASAGRLDPKTIPKEGDFNASDFVYRVQLARLGGCVHNFVPPPGHLSMDVTREATTSRLKARGMQRDVAFGAAGSPKFVGISIAAMAPVSGAAGALEGAQNFDDCMLANCHLIDDGHAMGHPPVLAVTNATPIVALALSPSMSASRWGSP